MRGEGSEKQSAALCTAKQVLRRGTVQSAAKVPLKYIVLWCASNCLRSIDDRIKFIRHSADILFDCFNWWLPRQKLESVTLYGACTCMVMAQLDKKRSQAAPERVLCYVKNVWNKCLNVFVAPEKQQPLAKNEANCLRKFALYKIIKEMIEWVNWLNKKNQCFCIMQKQYHEHIHTLRSKQCSQLQEHAKAGMFPSSRAQRENPTLRFQA